MVKNSIKAPQRVFELLLCFQERPPWLRAFSRLQGLEHFFNGCRVGTRYGSTWERMVFLGRNADED